MPVSLACACGMLASLPPNALRDEMTKQPGLSSRLTSVFDSQSDVAMRSQVQPWGWSTQDDLSYIKFKGLPDKSAIFYLMEQPQQLPFFSNEDIEWTIIFALFWLN